jgi:plastocyanin
MKHAIWTLGLVLLATVPFATANPLACSANCEVQGGTGGFNPVVLFMDDGADVHWIANDGNAHVNVPALGDSCFAVGYNGVDQSLKVRMDIVGGTLQATTDPGGPQEFVDTCIGAVATGSGAFVLHYFCALHPTTMKGLLVVGS